MGMHNLTRGRGSSTELSGVGLPEGMGNERGAMSFRCVFIADDLGMSPEINEAIFRTHRERILHGASLMADQRHTAEAVELARQHPDLPIGLHLNFSDKRWTENGSPWRPFPWKACVRAAHGAARNRRFEADFIRETRQQMEAFAATGLPLAFLNSHHHLHVERVVFGAMFSELQRLFPQFQGWIRLGRSRIVGAPPWIDGTLLGRLALSMAADPECALPKTTDLWGSLPVFAMQAHGVRASLSQVRDGFHEFYFHPGADKRDKRRWDPGLGDHGQDRSVDLDALLDLREANLPPSGASPR